MSKNLSKKFNAYTGKIINAAEFETAFENELKDRGTLAKIRSYAALKVSAWRADRKLAHHKIAWPDVYMHLTAAERARAESEMKRQPLKEYASDQGPITISPSIRVSAEKTYFEASSMLTYVRTWPPDKNIHAMH